MEQDHRAGRCDDYIGQAGRLSDLRRVEQLDRATLVLSTELHTGLIDEKRAYHCRVVPPFDADRQI